jgi:predicted metalloprotease with PDZ domain
VPFGETQRGGGRAVVFSVGAEAEDGDFADDWVATHEFSHLGMPAFDEKDAWMSEGFVQYFNDTLMGRAGILDERATWGEIVAGFDRGRRNATKAPLRDVSATMNRTHSYLRVYWAGAAIAMLLDVELRRASGGKQSLDDAMLEVHRAFADRPVEATSEEVIAHLDRWLGRPLFSETTSKWLAAADFPDVAPALAELGVVGKGRAVTLDDAAPLAAMRKAIMASPRR